MVYWRFWVDLGNVNSNIVDDIYFRGILEVEFIWLGVLEWILCVKEIKKL